MGVYLFLSIMVTLYYYIIEYVVCLLLGMYDFVLKFFMMFLVDGKKLQCFAFKKRKVRNGLCWLSFLCQRRE